MIRHGLELRRLNEALRLVPVLAWLVVQLSMATMPVSTMAEPHPPEIRTLFETLDTDRIVLCTPDGKQVFEKHDEHAGHAECRWCQSFASAVLPVPPTRAATVTLSSLDTGFQRNTDITPSAATESCHPSRAPPALI